MKGYGLTVFKGTEPERFDVEVIGVLHHFRPGEPLIVIKTPNPRLDVTKTVRGMSGSPIFLDGRLAGAYSYSLAAFELEPVAGVTPIDLMLTEMRRPIPPGFWPLERTAPLPGRPGATPIAPHPPHASLDRFDGRARHATTSRSTRASSPTASARAATRRARIVPAATPLMMRRRQRARGGRAAQARRAARPRRRSRAAAATATTPHAPAHFVNGGGLGVAARARRRLGDGPRAPRRTSTARARSRASATRCSAAATRRCPACIGRVLWIDASAQASHKVGECARSLGTLVQDRQTAIILDENIVAPTIPIDVDVVGAVGAPKTHWHSEITEDRFMAPGLAAVVLASVIEATSSERRDFTWKLTSKVDVAGPRPGRSRGRGRLQRSGRPTRANGSGRRSSTPSATC